jgi:hypothetical protein
MSREFVTERDIEDMAREGKRQLVVSEDIVLTDLAFEKAGRLGIELVQPHANPPAAPVRPYISQIYKPVPVAPATTDRSAGLKQQVKSAVMARLGSQVDEALIEQIIEKAIAGLGLG